MVEKTTQKVSLIDIAVPNDTNIADKRVEKLRKYTDLANEVKTLWQARKVEIIPIVVGCTGTFYKEYEKYIKKIDIVDESKTCMAQKIVLLGTAYLVCAFMNIILVFSIWKVLRENSSKKPFFFGNSSNFETSNLKYLN